jgi:hypothetical protein
VQRRFLTPGDPSVFSEENQSRVDWLFDNDEDDLILASKSARLRPITGNIALTHVIKVHLLAWSGKRPEPLPSPKSC